MGGGFAGSIRSAALAARSFTWRGHLVWSSSCPRGCSIRPLARG
jgi:hypothetical protein